jgi:hypothetical protein
VSAAIGRAGAVLLAALVSGCASAHVSGTHQLGAPSATKPTMVYVADFDLDARDVRTERGFLPAPPPLPGLDALPKLPGMSHDPAARADEVVSLMSRSLVKELEAAGMQARRLRKNEPLPSSGWLVRGVFTRVQEGSRLQRSIIGFGAGDTDLQVIVTIDDLTGGTPKPLYSVETKADSGKLPGAVITLNPYVAAARFAIAGGDLDRNVKQSATQIAKQTARYVAESKTVAVRGSYRLSGTGLKVEWY